MAGGTEGLAPAVDGFSTAVRDRLERGFPVQ